MSSKKLWNEVASEYEDHSYHEKDDCYPANKFRAKIVLDFFKKQEKGTVLDAGCGTAYIARRLMKEGWNCTCIDQSENMLEVAKKKTEKQNLKADFKECSILDMSIFEDNKFDFIMLNGVLPYVSEEDESKAYSECNRILKKGGHIIIAQYNALFDLFMTENYKKQINKLLTYKQVVDFDDKTMKYENPLTYETKLKKYGFKEENKYYYNFYLLPPKFTKKDDNLMREKLEKTLYDKWQGIFMAKTFVSIAKKV
jgi:ubiquinone/menaquinone biosynthesis C-methylase UbiE